MLLVVGAIVGQMFTVSAATKEPITIKFFHQYAEPQRLPYWTNLIDEYMKLNPNVKIEMEVVPNEPYKEKIRVQLGSKDAPDLFFSWDGEWIKRFADNDAILDLTPYLDADPEFKNSFNQGLLTVSQWDGKQYGLPIRTCVNFVVYNTEIFARYNIEEPQTWAEFIAILDLLKSKGVIPLAIGNLQGWPLIHYLSTFNLQMVPYETLYNDYHLVTGEFTDPGYIEALRLLQEFNNSGYFMPGVQSTSQDAAKAMFNAGRAAMIFDQTASFKMAYLEKMGADTWDVFPMPAIEGARGDTDRMVAWIDQFVVSSKTEHPEAVVDFLKFFYNYENQMEMQRSLGFVSPITSVSSDSSTSFPQLIKAMEIINNTKNFMSVIDLEMDPSIANVYLSGVQELFTSKTPEQLMKDIQAEAQRVMSEQ